MLSIKLYRHDQLLLVAPCRATVKVRCARKPLTVGFFFLSLSNRHRQGWKLEPSELRPLLGWINNTPPRGAQKHLELSTLNDTFGDIEFRSSEYSSDHESFFFRLTGRCVRNFCFSFLSLFLRFSLLESCSKLQKWRYHLSFHNHLLVLRSRHPLPPRQRALLLEERTMALLSLLLEMPPHQRGCLIR